MGIGGFLKSVVGSTPLGGGVKAAAAILSKFVDSPEDKQKLAEIADRASEREHNLQEAQIEVNKAEATHRSIWVAGWRPFVGWGTGFVIVGMGFVCMYKALIGAPQPDLQPLMPFYTLLAGMLGLNAGLRSFEKKAGVTR